MYIRTQEALFFFAKTLTSTETIYPDLCRLLQVLYKNVLQYL